VARKEIAFYLTKHNQYGLPLDNRRTYTKLDWILWTATLAEDQSDFERIVSPAYQFANDSESRVPLTDWYDTITAKQQGFQARSVVGGLFVRMLADPAMRKKYAGRALSRRRLRLADDENRSSAPRPRPRFPGFCSGFSPANVSVTSAVCSRSLILNSDLVFPRFSKRPSSRTRVRNKSG
jgi:hypothetical protein